MVSQLSIGTLGYHAIRTFEQWTVPVLAAVMAVMTVLAFSKGHVVWNHSTVHGSGLVAAAAGFMTAVGIGWGFSWVPWASDYSRFTRPGLSQRSVFWASAAGMFIALFWLGVLGAAMASSATNSDPAELVASPFGVMTIPVLLVIMHGAVGGTSSASTPRRCASRPAGSSSSAGWEASSAARSRAPSWSRSWPPPTSPPRSPAT